MKYIKPLLLIVAIIAIILILKFFFFPSEQSKPAMPAIGGKIPPSPVTVYLAGLSELDDKLYATGTIMANEEAELRPETSGRITFLNLPEGNQVAAGTILVKINDADLRAQLDKIKTQIKLSSESEARQKRMLQMEGTSLQEYDNALAALNSLKADSAYLQAQIAKTEIRAPFTGIIGIRNISPGSYITNTTVVATIMQTNPVKIDFAMPEKYADLLRSGDPISFKIDGTANSFHGKIIVKDPKIDASNRSVRYRAISQNPKGQLLPGAFARIELSLKSKQGNVFVPTECIVPTLKGKKVYVVKNGLAAEQVVETGLRTTDKIQILSGLSAGDSVIVTGNFLLKTGAEVKVIPAKN